MTVSMKSRNKKTIIIFVFLATIALLGGGIYIGHKQEEQKALDREHALYKHGFRLLEEQIAIYIKEHYEGVSKIEFSPIFEDGGDGYSMYTLNMVPVVYDKFGHRAILGGQIGKIHYKSYGLGGELTLGFNGADGSEVIELKKLDTGEVIDVSNDKYLPKEAEVETYSALDDNIDALIEDEQLKKVRKSDVGSPQAKVVYNLEIQRGDYTKWH